MKNIVMLPHQSRFVQAPGLFPEIRFFFFVGGYGSGKTRANVYALLWNINILNGKKDRAGDYARIIVAGITLAHLNKTFLVYFRQMLSECGIAYTENKKDNFFIVGTVMIILVPIENPETTYGFDAACVASDSRIIAKRNGTIRNILIKNMRIGDEVFTRSGWRKVLGVIPKGKKVVQRIGNTNLTLDHRVLREDAWVEAEKIRKGDFVWKTSLKRVKNEENLIEGLVRLRQILSCLTELYIIDTQIALSRADEIISGLRSIGRIIGHCGKNIEGRYRKDLLFTIKTVTRLTMRLAILSLCQGAGSKAIPLYTMLSGLKTRGKGKRPGEPQKRRLPIRFWLCAVRYALYAGIVSFGTAVLNIVRQNAPVKPQKSRLNQSWKEFAEIAAKNITATAEKLCIAAKDATTLTTMLMEERPFNCVVTKEPVKYAGPSLRQRIALGLRHVLPAAKILSEGRLCEVYDLIVDGQGASHEFFADGLLVHNCVLVEEIDELPEDKAVEAMKALNERCRQRVKGFREPYLCLGAGTKIICRGKDYRGLTKPVFRAIQSITTEDYVLTRKGWRRVIAKKFMGYKETVEICGVQITPDHRVWNDSIGDWQEAAKIGAADKLLAVPMARVVQWENMRKFIQKYTASLLNLKALCTIGGNTKTNRRVIIALALQNMRKLSRCMSPYGRQKTGLCQKEALSIISILTQLIISLKICRALLQKNIISYTENINFSELSAPTVGLCSSLLVMGSHDVRHVRKKCGESRIGRETQQERQGRIEAYGIRPLLKKFASTVEKASRLEQNSACGVEHVKNSALTNQRDCVRNGCDALKELGTEKEPVSYAETYLRLYDQLLFVLNRVEIRLGLLTNLALGDSFLRIGCASFVEKFIGRIGGGVHRFVPRRATRKPQAVFDLSIDDVPEFFTNKFLVHNCFSSTAQGQRGLYRIYMHFKKSGVGFLLLRGRTEDNPFLPVSQIRDMKKLYTKEEARVFMNAEFISISKGRVLGDFDWERNYLDYDLDMKLRPEELVIVAQDFNVGFSRASAYIVREGVIYCIKYYDFPDPQDAPSVYRHDFPYQKILWVPDVTIKDSFPQYAKELRKYDIQIIYRKKSPLVEDSVFLVNKLFYTGRLMICKIAKDVAEACALAMRDKDNKIPKGSGKNSPIHTIDTVRYSCSFIAVRDPAFADIRRLIIDKRPSFGTEPDNPVQDLGSGYKQVDPDIFLRKRKAFQPAY